MAFAARYPWLFFRVFGQYQPNWLISFGKMAADTNFFGVLSQNEWDLKVQGDEIVVRSRLNFMGIMMLSNDERMPKTLKIGAHLSS